MRYLAAYLLATLGGNQSPALSDLSEILGSVGIEVDNEKANKVIAELKGKNVQDLIKVGSEKLASVPVGGGAAPTAAAAPAAAAAAPAAEEKKEAKKQESQEDGSDDDMGFGLFD